MSALDKIVEAILEQASVQADGILNEAKGKAAEIQKKGESNCAEWKQQFEATVEQECREVVSQAESVDRQNRRLALLEARNQIIDEIIAEAKAKIADLPNDEYFDFMLRLFEKNAQPQDGIVHFAPADYSRIPDGFLERCKQGFPNYTLELYGDMEDISHGFVLQYGNILQNCSINGIFEAEWQMLRDKVYEVLTEVTG